MSDASKKQLQIRNSTAEFLIFTAQSGEKSIEVRYENETIWLTQKLMAALFNVDVRTISEHLQNIFASNELEPESVIRKFRNTAADGKKYMTQITHVSSKGAWTVVTEKFFSANKYLSSVFTLLNAASQLPSGI
jgi:hypothetical protein